MADGCRQDVEHPLLSELLRYLSHRPGVQPVVPVVLPDGGFNGLLAAHIGEKVNVLVASKSKDVHAGNVIKVLAPIVSGRGGGKPDMAMAGGSDANGIQDLLSAVAEQL